MESGVADVTTVSDKGQIVIPAHMRNKLGLGPRSKLLVYRMDDTIILKKLAVPEIEKEMRQLWKKVDARIAKYGEMSEEDIQEEIEKYRKGKRRAARQV